ncbi:MAM and LDL-receptor class A domain-containing protein 2 [Nymphon striatum]|nr:MAM and LDL-receptor class A domain-containing protein 2 [Nymphon striatum]
MSILMLDTLQSTIYSLTVVAIHLNLLFHLENEEDLQTFVSIISIIKVKSEEVDLKTNVKKTRCAVKLSKTMRDGEPLYPTSTRRRNPDDLVTHGNAVLKIKKTVIGVIYQIQTYIQVMQFMTNQTNQMKIILLDHQRILEVQVAAFKLTYSISDRVSVSNFGTGLADFIQVLILLFVPKKLADLKNIGSSLKVLLEIGNIVRYIPPGESLDRHSSQWTKFDNQGNRWRVAHINDDTPYQHELSLLDDVKKAQIVFEALSGYGNQGDIAIDDVSTTYGACSNPGSCTFDQSLCSWTNTGSSKHRWSRVVAQEVHIKGVPQIDAGPKGSIGAYLTTGINSPGDYLLTSEYFSNSVKQEFTFWYFLVGNASLSLSIKMSHQSYQRWMTAKPTSVWIRVVHKMENVSGKEYQIAIHAKIADESGIVGIDQFVMYLGDIPTIPPITYNCKEKGVWSIPSAKVCDFHKDCHDGRDEDICAQCDFQHGWCGWIPRSNPVAKWHHTLPFVNSPIPDRFNQTTATSYLYYKGIVGTLKSPAVVVAPTFMYKSAKTTCTMTFWYSFGQHSENKDARLTVSINSEGLEGRRYQANIEEGMKWKIAVVHIGQISKTWQVEISADRTQFVAVDDVTLNGCGYNETNKCSNAEILCPVTHVCISKMKMCDSVNDCGDNFDEKNCENYTKCTLEDDESVCDWMPEDKSRSSRWLRMKSSGNSAMGFSGPFNDHTYAIDNLGHYFAFESSWSELKYSRLSDSSLLSANYSVKNSGCDLTFFSYLYGPSVQSVKVFRREYSNQDWIIAWYANEPLGQRWIKGTVKVTSAYVQFRIEGSVLNKINSNLRTIIAIDDITLGPGCAKFDGPLPKSHITEKCKQHEFSCSSGYPTCINKTLVCNYFDDCSDGSDEASCGPCDFENAKYGICGWEDTSVHAFKWKYVYDPINDMKTSVIRPSKGYVKIVGKSSGPSFPAILTSPEIKNTSKHCTVSFWYFIEGSGLDSFQLNVASSEVYKIDTTTASTWREYKVCIGQHLHGWRAALIAYASKDSIPTVIVDDIKFSMCSLVNHPVDCNFNSDVHEGTCWWKQETDDAIPFKRSNNARVPIIGDITAGSYRKNDYYLYQNQMSTSSLKQSRLISPVIQPTETSCFSFWYYVQGEDIGRLSLSREILNRPKSKLERLWWSENIRIESWSHAEIEMNSSSDHVLYLDSLSPNVSQASDVGSIIAIDNIKYHYSACHRIEFCDFQNGLCGWSFPASQKHNWLRTNSKRASLIDHTYQSKYGKYLILFPHSYKIRSSIQTSLTSVGDMCLKFWFTINGKIKHNLSVFSVIKSHSGKVKKDMLWSTSASRYSIWKQGHVTIDANESTIVSIEGELDAESNENSNEDSFIALDDVSFIEGKCAMTSSCNFQFGLCGWNADDGWERTTSNDLITKEHPPYDHTYSSSNGYYLYTSLPLNGIRVHSLVSPEIHSTVESMCLRFFIYNLKSNEGLLIVEQAVLDYQNITLKHIYLKKVTEYNWQEEQVTIPIIDGKVFNLILTARIGILSQSNMSMSIDDISILSGACGTQTTPAPTTTSVVPTLLPSIIDSNFEHPLSRWMGSTDFGNFTRISGMEVVDSSLLPKIDHTTLTSSGHYMVVKSNGKKQFILISVNKISVDKVGGCLKFWYILRGQKDNSLMVALRGKSSTKIIMSGEFDTGPTWQSDMIDISDEGNFKLIFAVSYQSNNTVSAIDDISYRPGRCPSSSECTFENGLCQFSAPFNVPIGWKRMLADSKYGPGFDHTGHSSKGHYLALKKNTSGKEYDIIITPTYSQTMKCAQFWYSVSSTNPNKQILSVHIQHAYKSELLWSYDVYNGQIWNFKQIQYNPLSDYILIFHSELHKWYHSHIKVAIDDFKIRENCPTLGSCDFEDDMCGWSTVFPNSKLDLVWSRSMPENIKYYPKSDHSFGSEIGVFLLLNSQNGHRGELFSPIITSNENKCFSFWYWKQGLVPGTLKLYMKLLNHSDHFTNDLLWSVGAEGSTTHWKNVNIKLQKYSVPYQLYFDARFFGPSSDDVLALDDFSISSQQCTSDITSLKPLYHCDGKEIYENQICNFYNDCVDGRDEHNCGYPCSFENDFCNWKPTSKQSKIVRTENSTNHNFFIRPETASASIISPIYHGSASTCKLVFSYQFKKTQMSRYYAQYLISMKKSFEDDFYRDTLAGKMAPEGTNWSTETVYIGRERDPFQIIFTLVGNDEKSCYVHIDNINFVDCAIPVYKERKCSEDQFKCKNGNCIARDLLCDFTDDCGDFSDENSYIANCDKYAGRCSFEGGTCDWSEENNGTLFKWNIIPGNLDSLSRDHTFNDANGHVASKKYETQQPSIFVSPLITLKENPYNIKCSLRFYSYIETTSSSIDDVMINVYSKFQELSWSKVATFRANETRTFIKHIVNFKEMEDDFEVKIEGVIHNKYVDVYSSSIIIDDISFSQGCAYAKKAICSDDLFACGDGKTCISSKDVCNFRKDCPDGLDESLCPSRCTFDNKDDPMCYWNKAGNKSERLYALDASEKSTCVPEYDYTPSHPVGYYFAFNSYKNKSSIISPEFEESTATCELHFYIYYCLMMPEIELKLSKEKAAITLLRPDQQVINHNRRWQLITVGIGRHVPSFYVVLTSKETDKDNYGLIVDDISFVNCAFPKAEAHCPSGHFHCKHTKACVSEDRVCDMTDDCGDNSDEELSKCYENFVMDDFENNSQADKLFHQGKNLDEDEMDWINVACKVHPKNTNPSIDHTYFNNDGHYMMIPAVYPFHYDQRAWLVSNNVYAPTSSSNPCVLTLYYYMFGADVNTLSVLVQYYSNGPGMKKWTLSGSVGPYWKRVQVEFQESRYFRIIIEGLGAKSYQGNIAIDDAETMIGIAFHQKLCLCCDGNLCGWSVHSILDSHGESNVMPQSGLFHWEAIQMNTIENPTEYMPQRDHTKNSPYGWCLLADARPGRKDAERTYGKRWIEAQTLIGNWTEMKICIRAVRGQTYENGLAIDDIKFNDCAPPIKPDHGECQKDEFTCDNGGCISQDKVCDYANDCIDGSDERDYVCNGYYGRCNFEHGLCSNQRGWKQVDSPDNNNWKTSCPSEGDIPAYDHNMKKGTYFIFKSKGSLDRLQFFSDDIGYSAYDYVGFNLLPPYTQPS